MTRIFTRLTAVTLSAALASTALVALTPAAALAVPAGGYANLVETVSPAVVYVEVTGKASAIPTSGKMPEGDMLEEFKRRFGDQMPQQDSRPMKIGRAHV